MPYSRKKKSEIYFEHGEDLTDSFIEEGGLSYEGLCGGNMINEVLMRLKRDVCRARDSKKDFFNILHDRVHDEIYFSGFSFSDVDCFYLENIIGTTNSETVCYLNDFK